MSNPAWYDVEMRGRRLEAISKDMNTKYWNTKDQKLKDAYLDRMLKIEHVIQPYVEEIIGLNKFLKRNAKADRISA